MNTDINQQNSVTGIPSEIEPNGQIVTKYDNSTSMNQREVILYDPNNSTSFFSVDTESAISENAIPPVDPCS